MALIRMRKLYNILVPISDVDAKSLESIPANEELFIDVKDMSKSETRKACQNRLYWSWLHDMEKTSINEHAGNTDKDWHIRLKKDYLLPIFERDSQEWAETLESLRDVHRAGLKDECRRLIDHIVKQDLSTTDATIKQFCEYLTCVERFAHMNGILLRTDSALYSAAFGEKKSVK